MDGISIIISTYNTPQFLEECISSIKNQKVNFEVEIILGVDSCDKTIDFIPNYIDYENTIKSVGLKLRTLKG